MDGERLVEDRKPGMGGLFQRVRAVGENPWTLRSLRTLVTVPLLCLTGFLVVPVADEYQDQQTYRHASVCPAGQDRTADEDPDCLVPGTGLVTDKITWSKCESIGYGAEKCRPAYKLQTDIRVQEERRTEWIDVGKDIYRSVERRDLVDLYVWHDEVARIAVGDRTERLDPYFGLRYGPMAWLAGAWLVLVAAGFVAMGYTWMLFSRLGLLILGCSLIPFIAIDAVIEGALFGSGPMWVWIVAAIGMAVGSAVVVSGLKEDVERKKRRRGDQGPSSRGRTRPTRSLRTRVRFMR
ncbi:hypothetical protein [Streptomyces sp. NBC_00035]|uniref:hypothetical protein n=1 Tax=Streptomyces sp. NBC_00035 TaxID=2903614 RepID=UPI0032435DD5